MKRSRSPRDTRHALYGRRRWRRSACKSTVSIVMVLAAVVQLSAGVANAAPTSSPPPPPPNPPTFPAPMGDLTSSSTHLDPPVGPAAPTNAVPGVAAESFSTFARHTRNPDGRITSRLFAAPTFRTNAAPGTAIDAAVQPTGSADQPLAAPNALRPIKFGSRSANLVELGMDRGPVVVSAPSLSIAAPTPLSDGVLYRSVATDTDLRYHVSASGLKEELVLNSAAAPTSFTFHLSDPKAQFGKATATPGGGYRFAGRIQGDVAVDVTPVAAFEQPASSAAPPAFDPASAHLGATPSSDGYDLTVSVDQGWLKGKSFPVILDPTIAFNEANNAGSASFKGGWAFKPTSGVGTNVINTTSDHLNVGTYTNGATDYEPARSYLQFDVSSIPAGSTISAAVLGMYLPDCVGAPIPTPPNAVPPSYLCNNGTNYVIDLHHMSGAWSAASTWSQLVAATSATVLATDTINVFAPPDETNPPQRTFTNLATEVGGWVSAPATNNGVSLQLRTETTNVGGPSYYSSRGGYIFHPALTVTYAPPAGAPQSVAAAPLGASSATVTWAPPLDNGGSPPTSYTVTPFQGTTAGTPVMCVAPCSGQAITTGLTPGLSYTFTVAAVAAGSTGPAGTSGSILVGPNSGLNSSATSDATGAGASTFGRGQTLTYAISLTNPGTNTLTHNLPTAGVSAPLGVITAAGTGLTTGPCSSAVAAVPRCVLAGNTLTVTNMLGVASYTFSYQVQAIGAERGCSTSTVTSSLGTAAGATLPLTVCDSGLGLENWRTYVSSALGPQSTAKVDVANGNLVVQATDTTPVQAHGRFAYVLRRTYNSQDSTLVTLPGSIGAGWQLAISQAGDLVGAGVGVSGLYVPPAAQLLTSPAAVTLIDRDGTRHLFQPKALAAFVDVSNLNGLLNPGLLGGLVTKVLSAASGHNLCVDETFTSPAGVHVALWRYLDVTSGATPCAPAGGTTPTVVGFGAERPDRVHYEFDATGRLLDMVDGNGVDLRYRYDSVSGRLSNVYEPRSSCPAGPTYGVGATTCRAFTFNYSDVPIADGRALCLTDPAGPVTCATDPAGRLTRYVRDGSSRLVKVANPDGNSVVYGYGTCSGSTTSLCSAGDPAGHASSFTYAAPFVGLPRVTSLTDRRQKTTTVNYATADYVTFDTAGANRFAADTPSERRRFVHIDTTGRVGEVDEGDTADNYSHQYLNVYDDGGVHTCRQPDPATVDNNLCQVTKKSLSTFAPDEVTNYVYGAEGQPLATDKVTAPTDVKTTSGYHAIYVQSDGSALGFDDTVVGAGTVTSAGPTRGNSNTVYVLSDRTQSLTPRGNAPGATVATYLTTYKPDNAATVSPNAPAIAATCANPANPPATNTGDVCEVDAPTFDGSHATVTRYTYDAFGQRATMTSPKVMAEGGQPTTYMYYADSDLDLSAAVSAGGWLKGVTDPLNNFVAFAYDRAGNVARTWDRASTARALAADATKVLSTYPGAALSPFNTQYHETLYGPFAGSPNGTPGYSAPWRSLRSDRDPLANTATYTVDPNDNRKVTRPPRGTAAGTNAFDVTQAYDENDNLMSVLLPLENQAITSQSDGLSHPTVHAYDNFNNRTSTTDPNGHVMAYRYDGVNRQLADRWTTTSSSPACKVAGTAEAPLPAGAKACFSATGRDGTDNVIGTQDGNAQITYISFDGAHRQIQRSVPRNDGVYTSLVTTTNYDPDGHVLDVCPPREGDTASHEPDATRACGATAPLSTHHTYDAAGRGVSTTTYRTPGVAQVTALAYDADGNSIQTTDANGHVTTTTHNTLDRKATQSMPRDATTWNLTSFIYDPSGNLTAVTEPGTPVARVTAYGYDADNRLTDTVVGADNVVAAQAGSVDAHGTKNVHTRTAYDADGHSVARYDARAFDPGETVGLGTFVVRTDFDTDGRPSAQYVPRYDAAAHSDLGLAEQQVSGNPQTSQCPTSPSPAPQIVTGVAPYASSVGVCVTRIASFDRAGNPASLTMPTSTGSGSSNRHVDYTYTDDNRAARVNAPDPEGGSLRVFAATYGYDGIGQVVSLADANIDINTTAYTSDNLVASKTGQASAIVPHTTNYGYDANGNRTTVTDPAANATTTTYTDDNLKKAVTVPDPRTMPTPSNDITSYVYDAVGNPTRVAAPSATARDANNPGALPTVNAYTFDNLVADVLQPVTTAGGPDRILTQRHTTYAYDPGGRKLSQTTKLTDAADALVGGISGQNTAQGFSWFPNDRMQTQTGRDAATITTDYDAAGNRLCVYMTASCATDTAAVVPSYFADGLVRQVGDGRNTVRFGYDGSGSRVARKDTSASGAYLTTYAYNDAEVPVSMASQAAGWAGGSPAATAWSYDTVGRMTLQVIPSGLRTTNLWNFDDTLISAVTTNNTNPPTSANTIASWTYVYDRDYRQTQQRFTGLNNVGTVLPDKSLYYSYDAAGRVSAVGRDAQSTLFATWDHDGNRTAYNDPAWGTVTDAFRADDSIATHSDPGARTSTYNAWGGLEGDGAYAYVYDGFDRVRCVGGTSMPGSCSGATDTYIYDGLDRRRSHVETTGTTALHYDGLADAIAVEEKVATPKDVAMALDPSDMPVGSTDFSVGTTPQYLGDDGHGNITTVTGPTTINCTARYDPFGTSVNNAGVGMGGFNCYSGSTSNDLFYRSERRDKSTGDYQLGARSYDPKKAAFTTPDSYRAADPAKDLSVGTDPLTANRYNYVNGDPVNLSDPSGHASCDDSPQTWRGCSPRMRARNEANNRAEAERAGYVLRYRALDALIESMRPQMPTGCTERNWKHRTLCIASRGAAQNYVPNALLLAERQLAFDISQGAAWQRIEGDRANVAINSPEVGMLIATLGLGIAGRIVQEFRAPPVAAEGAEGLTVAGEQATIHGAERLTQAGFTKELIAETRAAYATTQADGASVFVREVSPGRFDFFVEGENGVVTAHRGWSLKSVSRLAANYGWEGWPP